MMAVQNYFETAPANTVTAIQKLHLNDHALLLNTDARDFARHWQFDPAGLPMLRVIFRDIVATSYIQYLLKNPSDLAILLGRDMDDIYFHAEQLLSLHNQSLGLSPQEKISVYQRLRLQNGSRKLFEKAMSPDDIFNILGITEEDLETKYANVSIFDNGYKGSIAALSSRLLGPRPKLRWFYIWRHHSAPNDVHDWLPNILPELRRRLGAASDIVVNHPDRHSFRVALMDHQPKWNGQSQSLNPLPIHIMLDLDDTIIKDVSVHEFERHPLTQTISYRPEPKTLARYRQRLLAGNLPGKSIHYKISPDGVVTTHLTVRPTFANLLNELRPLVLSGAVRIVVTSAADFDRSIEIVKNLKMGNLNFSDYVSTVLSPSAFTNAQGLKDTRLFRNHMRLDNSHPVVVVDDLAHKISSTIPTDYVFAVPAFGRVEADRILRDINFHLDFQVQDQQRIRELTRTIYQMRMNEGSNSPDAPLRAIAQHAPGLLNLIPDVSPLTCGHLLKGHTQ